MGEQKVVLVTGATSGIGKATAELLAAKGYRVSGTTRDPAGKSGHGFELLQLDVTPDESAAACVEAVAQPPGGRIDVLHNTAGTGIIGAAEEVPSSPTSASTRRSGVRHRSLVVERPGARSVPAGGW